MLETLQGVLAPYYLYIKLVHVPFSMLWLFSVLLGFSYMLLPVMRAWRRSDCDPGLTVMRNWVFERFDQGVAVEHFAFPIVLISGLLLLVAGGWGPESGWLVLKISIVVAIALPIEIADYYISHFGGNKRYLRDKSDPPDWGAYETALHRHWWFLLTTTPMIVVIILSIPTLAIVKPF